MNNLDAAGPYIWLRYATQYTKDGRVHTIEMSVPVPLGASMETREQLIREAEEGMQHMLNHVEPRLPSLLQNAPGTKSLPTQGAVSVPKAVDSAVRPASTPAPLTVPQPSRAYALADQETMVMHQVPVVPPTRSTVGPGMPVTPGPASDTSATLSLPEFLQYIKENLNLSSREAMNLLKVRSLSTGINLRDALEQLRHLVAQNPATDQKEPDNETVSTIPTRPAPPASSPPAATPRVPVDDEPFARDIIQIREVRPAYVQRFDEEDDPNELEDLDDLDEEDEQEDLTLPTGISPQRQAQAHSIISQLREMQGAAVASPKRLQVLNTIADNQVTEEQLQAVASGIWGILALKKLKVDQVESLISWAKQDYFVEEVEAVLAVLEEERYARGNR